MPASSSADDQALLGAKALLREAVLLRREVRPADQRVANDHARFELIKAALLEHRQQLRTVAAYLSVAPEPGTLELIAWLAAKDVRVLLPVLTPVPGGPKRRGPDWAEYAGPDHLRTGVFSIIEPTTDALGADALADAELIFAPALAANRAGDRLGRGGGWYDRALAHANPATEIWTLLNDDEVLEVIPAQSWDRKVHVLAAPSALIRVN